MPPELSSASNKTREPDIDRTSGLTQSTPTVKRTNLAVYIDLSFQLPPPSEPPVLRINIIKCLDYTQ